MLKFSNSKVAGCMPAILLLKEFYPRHFSVNFVTFLSTVYFRTPSNKCAVHRSPLEIC